jgi:hypothetical protein
MPEIDAPEFGTPEYKWWVKGAAEEARLTREGMTHKGKQFFECVETLAQRGSDPGEMLRWLTAVFTADWSARRRARFFAWLITYRMRWRTKEVWRRLRKCVGKS